MKKLLFLLLVFFLCSASNSDEKFVENFRIGKREYSIYEKSEFLHDDNWNAIFFIVRSNKSKNIVCSSFKNANRNDTIFVKGNYEYNSKELIFKEYYYYKSRNSKLDSIKKKFLPNKTGKLYLAKVDKYESETLTHK